MRAVRTDWGPAVSICVDSDTFPQVIAAITGEAEGGNWTYSYSSLDESFILRIAKGDKFLEMVRKVSLGQVMSRIGDGLDPADVDACVLNMRAMARRWAKFVDEDGGLEIWVDPN